MVETKELIVITHEDFELHMPPDQNPERPERIRRALEAVRELSNFLPRGRKIKFVRSPKSSISFFSVVHSKRYLKDLDRVLSSKETIYIDPDTYVSPNTKTALERLAGASNKAIVYALSGRNSLIIARPPSHHAGIDGKAKGAFSQGFCLVNATAAIANVLASHGRVVVLDFDAHHGNGTAEIFYERGDVLHIDLHLDPRTTFPYSGFPNEIGIGEGEGTKINIVLPTLVGDDVALDSLKLVELGLKSWVPDYTVISAGFDCYRGDYEEVLSNVGTRFFYLLGRLVAKHTNKATVAVLEGGYGVGLERGLQAFIAGLLSSKEYPWDPLVRSSRRAIREYLLSKLELLLNIYDKGKLDISYRDKRVLTAIRKAILEGADKTRVLKLAKKLTL
ncbi:MAG: hypothetical protein QXK14_00140 [Acidilobaceae archaeon]